MQPFCPGDYHSTTSSSMALVPAQPTPGTSPTNTGGYLGKSANEADALNQSYASYNNWPNSYNNYQYGSCPPPPPPAPTQPQYPHTPHTGPTMVLYPHVYSTVNQNQIHLHLHGSDKIEQYLNVESGLTISSGRSSGVEIGIGTTDNSNVIMGEEESDQHQTTEMTDRTNPEEEHEVGDPNTVWRPY